MRLTALLLLVALGPCDPTGLKPPKDLVGTWGGENAGLIADDTSAHVHIGCTYGDVHQQIVPDSAGRFNVPGEHNITAYPVDRGILHPARFVGQVRGGDMTLTITLTDTAVTLGPVVLVYGKEPRMGPCPICRRPTSRRSRDAKATPSGSTAARRYLAIGVLVGRWSGS